MFVVQVKLSTSSPFGPCGASGATAEVRPSPSSSSCSPLRTMTPSPGAEPMIFSPLARTFLETALQALSASASPQFTTVRPLLEHRQISPAADAIRASRTVAENVPVIPVTQDLPTAVTKKSKADSPRSTTLLDVNLTLVNRRSADKTEEPSADVGHMVDESYSENCVSPELPVIGSLPAVRGRRTSSRQTKVISRRTPQGMKWYSLRTRHPTSDGGIETDSVPSLPDLAKFLTSTDKTDKGCTLSDISELYSDSGESARRLRSRRPGKPGDVTSRAEAGFSDNDYSPVFPLPPRITRSWTSLEFLKPDGRKEGSQVTGQLEKTSGVDDGIQKVSDIPDNPPSRRSESVVGNEANEAGDEPEQPLVSRLRSRSSESKSSSEKVPDMQAEQLLKQRSCKSTPGVAVNRERPDVPEDSPVSSQSRQRSGGKSVTDDFAHSKVLQSADSAEVPAVSPEKSCPRTPRTESIISSSDLELASQADCCQVKQSSSPATDSLISGSICRISDDTSFPTTSKAEFSPKSSPLSSSDSQTKSGNTQQKRASFQLRVNLQDRFERLSSSTSSLEDVDIPRSVSPAWPPSRRRRSLSTLPASDRKLRSMSRKDGATSETTAQRSLRLLERNADITSVSSQLEKTSMAAVGSPAR